MYTQQVKSKIVKIGKRKFVQIPKIYFDDFEKGEVVWIVKDEDRKAIKGNTSP